MFCVLAAPLEGALDAGRALATLAKERSQGFIDAEPYNTRTWNGVWVIPHLHVDGRGGQEVARLVCRLCRIAYTGDSSH